jgi:hypothetical protein
MAWRKVRYREMFCGDAFMPDDSRCQYLESTIVGEVVSRSRIGAGDGTRTRNPQLGKLMRYHCATPAQEGTKQKDGASKKNIPHHEQNV